MHKERTHEYGSTSSLVWIICGFMMITELIRNFNNDEACCSALAANIRTMLASRLQGNSIFDQNERVYLLVWSVHPRAAGAPAVNVG